MTGKADGTVYINSELDTSGFKPGGKEIEAACRRAARSAKGMGEAAEIALKKMAESFVKQNQNYAKQEQKVKDLEAQLEKMSGKEIDSEALNSVDNQINDIRDKLIDLFKQKEDFLKSGGQTNSEPYKQMESELNQLRSNLQLAKKEKDILLAAGSQYTEDEISAISNRLISEKEKMIQMGRDLGLSYDSLKNKIEQYGGSVSALISRKEVLKKTFGSFVSKVGSAAAAMLGLHKNTKKANSSIGMGIKNILKYTLGISGLLALFGKIRSAVKTGMENLVQYSGKTNTSLSALKSSITQLKNSLATAFNPILTVITPILTRFIDLLSKAATYVGMFFAALTGKKTFTKAVEVQEDYAASLGDTADAAKKADKYLSGLDEIQTYIASEDTSGDGSQTLTPQEMFETVPIESKIKEFADKVKQTLSEMFAPLKESWDKYGAPITEKLRQIKDRFVEFGGQIAESTVDWFKNLNWDPLLQSVDNLLTKLQPLIDLILDGLAWAWENILLPFGKWTIEAAIPAVLDAIGGAIELITAVAEKAAPWLQKLWDNFLAPAAEFVGDAFVAFFETVGQVLSDIANNETAVSVLAGVAAVIGVVVAAITAWNVVQAILNALLLANPLTWIVAAIAAVIAVIVLCITYWDEIKAAIQSFWDKIVEVFGSLGEWFKEKWEAVKTATSNAWNGIKSNLFNIWNNIKTTVSNVFNSIKTFISNIWNGIVSKIKNSVNSVIGFINSMISGIISGINLITGALNGLKIDIPDWIPGFGGKSLGFNLPTFTAPQIPYLATGAVIPPNAPFLTVMGDQKNGRNLEMPENLLRQIVREESGGQGFNGTIRVPLIWNGRQVLEGIIDLAKIQQTVSGNNPFELA